MNFKIEKDPNQEDIKFILNLLNSSRFTEAEKEINRQMNQYPESSILFNILGALLSSKNNLDKAIDNYKKAIAINPNYAQAYNNLGIALQKLNKINEAVENYKKAIGIKNNFAEAYNNLGNALHGLMELKKALSCYEKAIKIKPNYFEAINSLGTVYDSLGNRDKAIFYFQKATKVNSEFSDAYNNLGIIYNDISKHDESLLSYKKAIELNPNNEQYYNNLGNLLSDLGKYDDASTAFNEAIKIKPDYALAYSNFLLNYNYKMNFDSNLYLSMAKKFRANCMTIKKKLSFKYKYNKKPNKLKVGLVSADFGNHPGGYFTLSALRELRQKDFNFIAYSTKDRADTLSPSFRSLFLKWNSIENKSDEEVIEQIIEDEIHILIDLQGHSAYNRLPIFIYKAAPIQATWHCQGSTGISEIDYMIGNNYLTPKNEEKHWIEKVLRLPGMAQCFTPPDFKVEINDLPAKKNKFITFGSLNKLNKMNDNVINLWSKILLSVSDSKLVLKTKNLDNNKIVNEIIFKFKKQNIDKERIILLGESQSRKEVLEVYNTIDIGLDPFPFQGYTTTCESLWMGVPVLTIKGNRYLFHAGESVISNLNMFDWIAENETSYVSKAIQFSSDI